MIIKEFINAIKDLNKKANMLNKSIPHKHPAKFANNPFREIKKGNTYIWVDKN